MADDKDPVVLRFRGDGTARIPGVPMRDLTKDDVKEIAPDALREAMASNLYEAVSGVRLPINRTSVEESPPPPEGTVPVATDAAGDADTKQGKPAKGGE